MKLSIIGSSLLIASSILYSAHFITSGLIGIISNSIGGSLDYSYSQTLLILSIISIIMAIILILIDFFKTSK